MEEILGKKLLNSNGAIGAEAISKAEIIGIYFSSHWCTPSRVYFTSKLTEAYKAAKAKGLAIEIVFVSFDNNGNEFSDYFGSMPWMAIPFADERICRLADELKIDGTPSLIILDKKGNVVCSNGREKIIEKDSIAFEDWIASLKK